MTVAYPLLCRSCGVTALSHAPLGEPPPEPCPNCGQVMLQDYGAKGIGISATALPNKNGPVKVDAKERAWTRDMDAYKALRDQGLQPRQIDGSHELEAKAADKMEIEWGGLLTSEQRKQARDGIEQAKEIQESL